MKCTVLSMESLSKVVGGVQECPEKLEREESTKSLSTVTWEKCDKCGGTMKLVSSDEGDYITFSGECNCGCCCGGVKYKK